MYQPDGRVMNEEQLILTQHAIYEGQSHELTDHRTHLHAESFAPLGRSSSTTFSSTPSLSGQHRTVIRSSPASAGLSPTGAQLLWIIDIYPLILAGLLVPMGFLGDRIGRRSSFDRCHRLCTRLRASRLCYRRVPARVGTRTLGRLRRHAHACHTLADPHTS